MNSFRDSVKDAIVDNLAGYFKVDRIEVDAELVGSIADQVFEVLGIEPKEQNLLIGSGTFIFLFAPSGVQIDKGEE